MRQVIVALNVETRHNVQHAAAVIPNSNLYLFLAAIYIQAPTQKHDKWYSGHDSDLSGWSLALNEESKEREWSELGKEKQNNFYEVADVFYFVSIDVCVVTLEDAE